MLSPDRSINRACIFESITFTIFMIFIGLLLSLFVKIHAYTSNTYNIPEDDLHIYPSYYSCVIFPDGSKLLRFYRPIDAIDECHEPNLHLKLLHKNGTLTNFNIQNLSIPRLNFCKIPHNQIDFIETKSIGHDIFYLLYYNISESDPTIPFGRLLLEINLKGEILR